jgi:anion-transporting  ArsA/GET3 family ATPase
VVVNMVIAEQNAETVPEFVRNRIAMQEGYLAEIGQEFDGEVRAVLPLYDSEIRGVESLKMAGEALFA